MINWRPLAHFSKWKFGRYWPWRGGDRSHNELHQHQQSIRDVGGGVACQESGCQRIEVEAVCEDESRPRSRVVTDYLQKAGTIEPLAALASCGRLRLHDVHRNSGPLPEA